MYAKTIVTTMQISTRLIGELEQLREQVNGQPQASHWLKEHGRLPKNAHKQLQLHTTSPRVRLVCMCVFAWCLGDSLAVYCALARIFARAPNPGNQGTLPVLRKICDQPHHPLLSISLDCSMPILRCSLLAEDSTPVHPVDLWVGFSPRAEEQVARCLPKSRVTAALSESLEEHSLLNEETTELTLTASRMLVITQHWDLSLLRVLPLFKKQVVDLIAGQIHNERDFHVAFSVTHTRDLATARAVSALLLLTNPLLTYSAELSLDPFDICHTPLPGLGETLSMSVSVSVESGTGQVQSMKLTGEVLLRKVDELLRGLLILAVWMHSLEPALPLLSRTTFTTIKDRTAPRGIGDMRSRLLHTLHTATTETHSQHAHTTSSSSSNKRMKIAHSEVMSGDALKTPKPLPSEEEGLTVFEFFSGIGGMRLALPNKVQDLPIKRIVAYDCSSTPNMVYHHNFHCDAATSSSAAAAAPRLQRPQFVQDSTLRNVMVEGLRLENVDGKADIWTMSPPCQPYTTTRGAGRKDHLDNRSRGLYHLMTLLLNMRQPPRWLLVENVKGFVGSVMHGLWVQVMRRCGYDFEQYVLSPEQCVGLPNTRKRFYFLARLREPEERRVSSLAAVKEEDSSAERDSDEFAALLSARTDEVLPSTEDADKCDLAEDYDDASDGKGAEEEEDNDDANAWTEKEFSKAGVRAHLPHTDSIERKTIGEVLHSLPRTQYNDMTQLLVPAKILESSWAAKMISLARDEHTLTYCFTKGYGKIYDHSAGSCYVIPNYSESGAQEEKRKDVVDIDRERLGESFGRVRLFHPSEQLLLFGFPAEFSFPAERMSLQQQFSCVGNSINVAVVRQVMNRLFSM